MQSWQKNQKKEKNKNTGNGKALRLSSKRNEILAQNKSLRINKLTRCFISSWQSQGITFFLLKLQSYFRIEIDDKAYILIMENHTNVLDKCS